MSTAQMARLHIRRWCCALVSGIALAGCADDFSDEAFGVLDLAPLYEENAFVAGKADPGVDLPPQIDPQAGFVDGQEAGAAAEYYDFGIVPFMVDPKTLTPVAVRVAPMYFFFTPDGLPLFSRPVREKRDHVDSMPGGKDTRNPNPEDRCASGAETTQACKDYKKTPYPGRFRPPLVDPDRRSADHQRPIVDVTPADLSGTRVQYTGLWQIVEVTVPRGYDPDAIKHAGTLEQAVNSGKFKRRKTDKVINCPLLDERTYVSSGVSDNSIFRPRIELWYRRKLTFCYLAHGWETLGNVAGELYHAGQDASRIDTFDVSRIALGDGPGASTQLVVPVRRAYSPAIYTEDPNFGTPRITRLSDNIVTAAVPRHYSNDPPGYTPMKWMFDFKVAENYGDVSSRLGKIVTSLMGFDFSNAVAQRRSNGGVVLKNLVTRGALVKCVLPRIMKGPLNNSREVCGVQLFDAAGGETTIDSSHDLACNAVGLECNQETCTCDVPEVKYGQSCGPGIARCQASEYDLGNALACYPPWGGNCYKQCNRRLRNAHEMENEGKKPWEALDSRCGDVPGYRCFNYGFPPLGGICLRGCNTEIIDPVTRLPDAAQCSAQGQVEGKPRDLGEGQTCQDLGRLQICAWPDGYTPN